MGRLIDADRLKAHYCWWAGGTKEMTIDEAKKTFDTIIDVQPTVEEEHGHWRKSYISAWHSSDDNDHLYLYCSVCGERIELQGVPAEKMEEEGKLFKYCPWCGAKMDEVEE